MIRVLIIDDSAFVRKTLQEELAKYEDIEVVGTAGDPYIARDKIAELNPDVLTLDLEMPRMDGLTFLARLMKFHPLPVVVVSSLAPENSAAALKAFELGAVEVISKPGSQYSVPSDPGRLARSLRAAACSKITRLPDPANQPSLPPQSVFAHLETTHKVVAIGASTGGTQAIEAVLHGLPATTPGTVIVQHMPEHFTKAFADRLGKVCAMEVREARDRDHVIPGVALVAPGNRHMVLQRSGSIYQVQIKDGPPVYHQRPSVDVLFHSVARNAGVNAVGVILTGMGADGAKGLLAMREQGARTIAQDEHTSVVFGMPKEAVRLGAAESVVPLDRVAKTILGALTARQNKTA